MGIKKAFVTGATGQSASYLIEKLLEEGYQVWGLYRRSTSPNFKNLQGVIKNPNLQMVCGDVCDPAYIFSCLSSIQPDEIYNLAAQSFVKASFDQPIHTFDVDTVGVLNMLEWVRQNSPKTKFYQASTSEMFGKSKSTNFGLCNSKETFTEKVTYTGESKIWRSGHCTETPMYIQNENTPFIPQSPYAIAKLAAHHLCRLYREAYGLFIISNITFNHESPRRGKEFVTRKITDYIGRLIKENFYTIYELGKDEPHSYQEIPDGRLKNFPKLALGNIYSSRDWGHARDFMEAAYLAMQHSSPDDYVVCTGVTHTVEDFLFSAFSHVGLDWKDYVVIDQSHMRPAEVDYLCGSANKIKTTLGWEPKTTFKQLVEEMVENDIKENFNG